MLNWLEVLATRERYNDYVREAEHERLVRRLSAKRESSDRLYYRLLAWLGSLLIAMGRHLQERYGGATRISRPLASLSR
jgi:hypothetical protein